MDRKFPNRANDSDRHERYVELCALSTSGSLTADESRELEAHLERCTECRQALSDYGQVIRQAIPAWGGMRDINEGQGAHWSPKQTKERLFARLDGRSGTGREGLPRVELSRLRTGRAYYMATAAVLLLTTVVAYFAGLRHERPMPVPGLQAGAAQALQNQITELTRQRDELELTAGLRAQKLQELNAKMFVQSREVERLKELAAKAEVAKNESTAESSALRTENAAIKDDRASVAQRLQETQTLVAALRQDANRLQAQRVEDLLNSATLQEKIDDLSGQVNASKAAIKQQQKLLASDRDIRELMGARDLYIADVYDVDHDGHNKQAFGRVFYTKNKSLVFYAFDLDKAGFKNASAFQAWGEKSDGKERPANLGIFYMDNSTNRRWVLKFDNPEVMQQINAVFVTVEPKGGSEKPSGKQLLYAYLRTTANHP